MEMNGKVELLKNVAETINHDANGRFIPGETERLDLIKKLLAHTDYDLTVVGLCHLYTKRPITELPNPVTVISSHIDTHRGITKPFSEMQSEKKLCGTYDNSITNAAVLILMLEDMLPDTAAIAFTGDEEYGMTGAEDLSKYLIANKIKANIIVTDVTDRGYKGKNDYTLENRCHSGKWTKDVKDLLKNSDFKWKLKKNYEDDETCAYSDYGFECFSLCIPTKGEMHDNSGLETRISTYIKYIEALHLAAWVS